MSSAVMYVHVSGLEFKTPSTSLTAVIGSSYVSQVETYQLSFLNTSWSS